MKKIAVFASGTGSNALKIIEYFKHKKNVSVELVVSNNKNAGVLDKAKAHNVPILVINRQIFYKSEAILDALKEMDLVVLAGFMWLVPGYMVAAFPNNIINIHPALLPKFGGKGMYGMNVHQAVHAAQEKETGITIHYVNEHYDEGNIIFQAACGLTPEDTPEDIALKIRGLEHGNYPRIIEELLEKL
jgi:phosphoribosylglycinamide formyltransferase-1